MDKGGESSAGKDAVERWPDLDEHEAGGLGGHGGQLQQDADQHKVELPVGRNRHADGHDDHVDKRLGGEGLDAERAADAKHRHLQPE